mmetsp:Transcript_109926/g.310721  ORF Transcript_109926/g.310721 Transcript_109926/m.310721 type:complete len:237 (+) Transcript_109926:2044-2754(+)
MRPRSLCSGPPGPQRLPHGTPPLPPPLLPRSLLPPPLQPHRTRQPPGPPHPGSRPRHWPPPGTRTRPQRHIPGARNTLALRPPWCRPPCRTGSPARSPPGPPSPRSSSWSACSLTRARHPRAPLGRGRCETRPTPPRDLQARWPEGKACQWRRASASATRRPSCRCTQAWCGRPWRSRAGPRPLLWIHERGKCAWPPARRGAAPRRAGARSRPPGSVRTPPACGGSSCCARPRAAS